MPPLPPTKWIISFCHFNMELMRNKKNIQSDNIKTPTKQTDKLTVQKIRVIRRLIMPPRSNQLIKPSCSSTFWLHAMMQCYCKSSFQTPTTGFWELVLNILYEDVHSQLCAYQAEGRNYHQCSSIFTMQGNVTGIICRVITHKDKGDIQSSLENKMHKDWSYI